MSIADIEIDETEVKISDNRSIEEVLSADINIITTKMELAEIESDEDFTGAAEWLKENKRLQKKVKDHFEDLTQAADRINKILQAKKSLNRFCIYRNKKDIFIDLVILDENNKITKKSEKILLASNLLKP